MLFPSTFNLLRRVRLQKKKKVSMFAGIYKGVELPDGRISMWSALVLINFLKLWHLQPHQGCLRIAVPPHLWQHAMIIVNFSHFGDHEVYSYFYYNFNICNKVRWPFKYPLACWIPRLALSLLFICCSAAFIFLINVRTS